MARGFNASHKHLSCKQKSHLSGLSVIPNTAAMYLISSPHLSPYPVKTDLQTISSLPTSPAAVKTGEITRKKIQQKEKRKGDAVSAAGKLGTWDWAKLSLGNWRPSDN